MDRSACTERSDNMSNIQEFVYKPGYSSHPPIDSSD